MGDHPYVLAALLAAVLAGPAWNGADGWTDLGGGLALDPQGRVVELAALPECQQLAAAQAIWSY